MAVILQLSDIHRSAADPVGNSELLAALESDRRRWPAEVGTTPDLVVISGDLVQGVSLGNVDYEDQLNRQYEDAEEFLDLLVDRFIDGDRSRLILVPGNHDVDWNGAHEAMNMVGEEEIKLFGAELGASVLDPASAYRWSWPERALYKVTDRVKYEQRCQRFINFRKEFYAGVVPDPLVLGADIVFCEYPHLHLSITGLSSWFGNDCYCHVGAFDPELMARAQDAISGSSCSVHIAVWHHSTAGPPADTGFLDVTDVHRLIDYGFRVGLHGHHHRTEATVMPLKLPNQEEMALISAGSLAAGKRELPAGVHRQYSIIQVWPADRKLRVHVREAVSDLIFASSSRTELGGRTYVDLRWSPTPEPRAPLTEETIALDEAYRAYAAHDLPKAAAMLREVDTRVGGGRKLRAEVLAELGEDRELVELLTEPQSQDELMILIGALCRLGASADARKQLKAHGARLDVPNDIRSELEAKVSLAEMGND